MDERLKATLGFVEKLTLRPAEVTRADAEAVLATGVSEEALADAVHVTALFSMIVRLADALDWDVPPARQLAARAPKMLEEGYVLMTPPEDAPAAVASS